MELTVLGCATPYPRPGHPCSGYLLTEDDTHLVLDCGPGSFAALQQHLRPEQVTAVWVSHLHPDHSADLLAWANWALNTPDAPRIPVHGPPGWAQRLNTMLTGEHTTTLVDSVFTVGELHDGHTAACGPLILTTRTVAHSVPAFGIRVDSPTAHVAYSGDTEPCSALTDLARDADLFICEAGTATPSRHHTTPGQAVATALAANAKHLLLTHLAPALDDADIDTPPALPVAVAVPQWHWHSNA